MSSRVAVRGSSQGEDPKRVGSEWPSRGHPLPSSLFDANPLPSHNQVVDLRLVPFSFNRGSSSVVLSDDRSDKGKNAAVVIKGFNV